MSDAFYKFIHATWGPPFGLSSSPILRGIENTPRTGPVIFAATHTSYFDVPALIYHTPRLLDFVSIVEQFRNPILAWFYGSMNAFPLDRSRADPKTVRIVLDRLAKGRAILIFPEGGIRTPDQSAIATERIRRGVGRIASLARAPIIPVVLINTAAYLRIPSWFPLHRTRYGIAYGQPIPPDADPAELESRLVHSWKTLHQQLAADMPPASEPRP
jgi:1-acyl-sn-glycerol-3-phosphate acyltransferase